MACAGTDVKALLQKCLNSIIGWALPYRETGDAEERALANTVTAGGLLLKHFTGNLHCCTLHALHHITPCHLCSSCLLLSMKVSLHNHT